METAVFVSGFLLLILIAGAHLSPDPVLLIGHDGGRVLFNPRFSGVDDYVLYRVYGDGDLCLVRCSQMDRPQPTMPTDAYNVKCESSHEYTFSMFNINMSHRGDYRAEGWRGGIIMKHRRFRLIVCAEGDVTTQKVTYDDNAALCPPSSNLIHGSNIQLYQYKMQVWDFVMKWSDMTLVLDTNSSLEPLVDDLRGRLQVDLNNLMVTLSMVTHYDSYTYFYCTIWRGAQCQRYSNRILMMYPKTVFAYEEEKMILSCIAKVELTGQVFWSTPSGHVQSGIDQMHSQQVVYMLEGNQTGDYSLIMPSVSLQHSGGYDCRGQDYIIKGFDLYVCIKFPSIDVELPHGESVILNITEHLNGSWSLDGTQWYRRKNLQPPVLILDSKNESVLVPEDLRGRVTVFTLPSSSTLIITNLTAKDIGVYTWRVYGKLMDDLHSTSICSEGTFRLLDRYGMHSPFHRVILVIIVLVGLVTAIIWFKLRSRQGEQTCGCQSRGEQQNGHENLYENIEMVELHIGPEHASLS